MFSLKTDHKYNLGCESKCVNKSHNHCQEPSGSIHPQCGKKLQNCHTAHKAMSIWSQLTWCSWPSCPPSSLCSADGPYRQHNAAPSSQKPEPTQVNKITLMHKSQNILALQNRFNYSHAAIKQIYFFQFLIVNQE